MMMNHQVVGKLTSKKSPSFLISDKNDKRPIANNNNNNNVARVPQCLQNRKGGYFQNNTQPSPKSSTPSSSSKPLKLNIDDNHPYMKKNIQLNNYYQYKTKCFTLTTSYYNKKDFNKQHYMWATFDFVVNPTILDNSGKFSKDPDVGPDWHSEIEGVTAKIALLPHESVKDHVKCPICLRFPKPAKITQCGHSYCFLCAVKYIFHDNNNDDKKSKKCAVCQEHFYLHQLKSVQFKPVNFVNVGVNVTMNLMMRKKGTNYCNSFVMTENEDDMGKIILNGKISSLNSQDGQFLRQQELHLLQYRVEKDDLSVYNGNNKSVQSFVNDHKLQLNRIISNYKEGEKSVSLKKDIIVENSDKKDLTSSKKDEIKSNSYSLASSVQIIKDEALLAPSITTSNSNTSVRRAKTTSLCDSDVNFSYFYQIADGQHIYLHRLNWECILSEFGPTVSDWPPTISGTVLECCNFTIDEAFRKRFRYLSHLALDTIISVVELDLGHLLSDITSQKFAPQLMERWRQRGAKAKKEDRQQKVAIAKLEEKYRQMVVGGACYNNNSVNLNNDNEQVPFIEVTPEVAKVWVTKPSFVCVKSDLGQRESQVEDNSDDELERMYRPRENINVNLTIQVKKQKKRKK